MLLFIYVNIYTLTTLYLLTNILRPLWFRDCNTPVVCVRQNGLHFSVFIIKIIEIIIFKMCRNIQLYIFSNVNVSIDSFLLILSISSYFIIFGPLYFV